jgi:hypothetical protein
MVPLDSATQTICEEKTMKTKTKVKSGALVANHNLRIKSSLKAGSLAANHNLRVRRA